MKKLFSVFVIAAVFALVACGPGKEDVKKNDGADSIIKANALVVDSLKQALNDTTTFLWDSIAKLNEGKPNKVGAGGGGGGTNVNAGQGKDNGKGGTNIKVDPNAVKAGQGKG